MTTAASFATSRCATAARCVGLANELNGLSLGGVGRGTEIDHVEIMNNVDDGIEIWGGTVNLKYVSIWNIGDDSFDVDEGWRGKAQFGLIVQGYCGTKSQGSGVGDNCFEMDGAEWASAQPVGAASIYNFTVIGQPIDGDDGDRTWRDNMRAQFGNCIFMDIGEGGKIIKNDVHATMSRRQRRLRLGGRPDAGGSLQHGVQCLSDQHRWRGPEGPLPELHVGQLVPVHGLRVLRQW